MTTASSKVVISGPMSLSGSAARLRQWIRPGILFWTVGIAVLCIWWGLIVCWYIVFGIVLVPYRLLRRGSRKRKKADLQHQELLDAVRAGQQPGA